MIELRRNLGKLSSACKKINKFNPVATAIRQFIFPYRVTHIAGPLHIEYSDDELVVICVCRDSHPYLTDYLQHYRSIGVRHFIFLDNGSIDSTLELLTAQRDVTLFASTARYSTNENIMKLWLAKTFCKEKWCLCADADEFFHHPSSDTTSLTDLLSYLNHQGYNAVVTQMLDMYRKLPISFSNNDSSIGHLLQDYIYYDTDSVTETPYPFPYLPNPSIVHRFGGTRKRLFSTNVGLTKVSLFRMTKGLIPFVNWHHVNSCASIADISCVLLHYPYIPSFPDKVAVAVKSQRYGYHVDDEYKQYFDSLAATGELAPFCESSIALNSINDLIAAGVMVTSTQFIDWARHSYKQHSPDNLS